MKAYLAVLLMLSAGAISADTPLPSEFESLGLLNTTDPIVINTDAASLTYNGTTYLGVMDNDWAVFNFDHVSLSSLSANGTPGLAILSADDISINGDLTSTIPLYFFAQDKINISGSITAPQVSFVSNGLSLCGDIYADSGISYNTSHAIPITTTGNNNHNIIDWQNFQIGSVPVGGGIVMSSGGALQSIEAGAAIMLIDFSPDPPGEIIISSEEVVTLDPELYMALFGELPSIPEPSTLIFFGIAFGIVGLIQIKKRFGISSRT